MLVTEPEVRTLWRMTSAAVSGFGESRLRAAKAWNCDTVMPAAPHASPRLRSRSAASRKARKRKAVAGSE